MFHFKEYRILYVQITYVRLAHFKNLGSYNGLDT